MNTKDSVAVLVVSCDRYRDLWNPFFALFWRFWPDCPFRVYLLSNTIGFSHPRVTSLLVGPDDSWSDNLIRGLPRVEEKYIFLFIDDLLLFEAVDTAAVLEVLEGFVGSNGNYLRMNPHPRPDGMLNHIVGVVSKGTIYRTATVSSVWKKSILLALLTSGETAWDFEVYGTVRSDAYSGFYSTHERLIPALNAVIKGKWERRALARIRLLGLGLHLGTRKVMSWSESFHYHCCLLRSRVFNLVPPLLRRNVKNLFLGKKGRGRAAAPLRQEVPRG